ncbi:hypothetical protein BJ684DRAFT_14526 [Piptocephalis cylindrospora]|uniref:Uncharacterized protein n=1 Tax=Piptocephalis cylindrospora TaxID=1907219 RepID=A0A4P9Y8T1_9FUNG|nr:hypothetical protein BJ684DRAFT_14526 [Piptocephalis cylindrospora]|eukprot:RKP15202.1 hypothetical protein BJ684DRAFT_14526 [Piptocephalis cylindrospora]
MSDELAFFDLPGSAYSDSEEEEVISKLNSVHLATPYTPKSEHDGWFHPISIDADLVTLMTSKHGPHQIKVAVEHHYMHRRCREWWEIGACAASKLGRHEEAALLIRHLAGSNEPGHHWSRSRILLAGGSIQEGTGALREYLSLRPGDANGWRALGDALLPFAFPPLSDISLLCYQHALVLYDQSSWPGDSGNRRERVLRELKDRITPRRADGDSSPGVNGNNDNDREEWALELEDWIRGQITGAHTKSFRASREEE